MTGPERRAFRIRPVHDPDARALVEMMNSSAQPALWERGVEGAREYIRQRAVQSSAGPDLEYVGDIVVPGDVDIPVRVYRPHCEKPLPAVVYLHGGGWVVGDVASSDAFARRLAEAAQCVVFSVDYRLAPEHPHPAGLDDVCAVVQWVAEHGGAEGADPRDLVLVGDSAGGNLATVAARVVTNRGVRVRRQVLAYPAVAGDEPFPAEYDAPVWPLTEKDRQWFLRQYIGPDGSATAPEIAPLAGDLTTMPPTTLLLGGRDPLFDEGLAYGEALIDAGVVVDLHVYAGQFHGFLTIDDAVLPTSRQALGVVANAIRNG